MILRGREVIKMRIVIIGGGGHAQVVADILFRMREAGQDIAPAGFLDDNPELAGRSFLGLPVLGTIDRLTEVPHDAVIIAIGDNRKRSALYKALEDRGERFATARHPGTTIAPDVRIGPGSMISAGVIVNPGSAIGADVILNTGSTADHHNRIGNHAHIAPGVHMGGGVTVDEGVLVGIGATVMPCRRIGAWSVVGAGAVVVRDIPPGLTVIGVPAQELKSPD